MTLVIHCSPARSSQSQLYQTLISRTSPAGKAAHQAARLEPWGLLCARATVLDSGLGRLTVKMSQTQWKVALATPAEIEVKAQPTGVPILQETEDSHPGRFARPASEDGVGCASRSAAFGSARRSAAGSPFWPRGPACGLGHGQPTAPLPDSPQATALEERLRRVEEVNARLLEQLNSDREESARRYGELEDRYRELQRRLGEPRPAAEAEAAPAPGETTARSSHLGRPGELGRPHATRELPLKARFADGFQLATEDDEFDLRFHVLDQTDFKLFTPNDRTFGKSGLYIPRVRLYLEGRLTRLWEYEVSLQRSLEGTWDLLDGNLNFHPSDAFQVKFGRHAGPLQLRLVRPPRAILHHARAGAVPAELRPVAAGRADGLGAGPGRPARLGARRVQRPPRRAGRQQPEPGGRRLP